jgi:hypothetical protein
LNSQTESVIKSIFDEELVEITQITKVLSLNNHRILRLLKQSGKLIDHIENKVEYVEYIYDIARASVVFLHSSLETMIREIYRIMLQDQDNISYIPLAKQSGVPNRKEKFLLSDLVKFRGKSINDVINDSILEYLSQLSINNTTDIANILERSSLSDVTIKKYYPKLEEMIHRRHQIVHEGDIVKGDPEYLLNPITIENISHWLDTTTEFCAEIIRITIKEKYIDKIQKRLKDKGIIVSSEIIERTMNVEVTERFQ